MAVAYLRAFGAYLPSRIVPNAEVGAMVDTGADWIQNVSGIEERRWAAEGESVTELAVRASEDCLTRAGAAAADVRMLIVSSGSAERRFPGPAAAVANRIGLSEIPAIDLPVASAGSLFGLSLAAQLSATTGPILVVAAEKMSGVVLQQPMDRGVAPLFGDGAGACLVTPEDGQSCARVIDSMVATDGAYTEDLRLEFGRSIEMNGRSVILQASRKIPRSVAEVLSRNGRCAADVAVFLMHQANQNLIVRVAEALGVAPERFFSNIKRYGNTSSASMLIAAKEWFDGNRLAAGVPVVFAAFGAGFHWGALLAEGVGT
jgi:3-oxoacyl-[acyl-carrier-protein] synthase III